MTIDCLGRDNDQFGLLCEDKSLTVQSDAIDADINTIVARYGITGALPTDLPYVTNLDLSEAPRDYMHAMQILESARDSFMQLPANVRSTFDNNPGAYMDFCSDPANLDKMRELGLAVPKPKPAEDVKPADKPA